MDQWPVHEPLGRILCDRHSYCDTWWDMATATGATSLLSNSFVPQSRPATARDVTTIHIHLHHGGATVGVSKFLVVHNKYCNYCSHVVFGNFRVWSPFWRLATKNDLSITIITRQPKPSKCMQRCVQDNVHSIHLMHSFRVCRSKIMKSWYFTSKILGWSGISQQSWMYCITSTAGRKAGDANTSKAATE